MLNATETTLLKGALLFAEKKVGSIMTPWADVFCLEVRLLCLSVSEGHLVSSPLGEGGRRGWMTAYSLCCFVGPASRLVVWFWGVSHTIVSGLVFCACPMGAACERWDGGRLTRSWTMTRWSAFWTVGSPVSPSMRRACTMWWVCWLSRTCCLSTRRYVPCDVHSFVSVLVSVLVSFSGLSLCPLSSLADVGGCSFARYSCVLQPVSLSLLFCMCCMWECRKRHRCAR